MLPTSAIKVILDNADAHYAPTEELTGRFMVDGTQPWQVRAAELSILWYTAGKGEEDMVVHHFERLIDEPGQPLDLRVPHRFSTTLPGSPLSYDGLIVKVCWCVRLRVFLPQGQETVAEIPFRLGSVQPASLAAKESGDADQEVTAEN